MNARDKGWTILELLQEKFRKWRNGGDEPAAAEVPRRAGAEMPRRKEADFYNPLQFALGGFVAIDVPPYFGATFEVAEVNELTRQIGDKKLRFTDYALHEPAREGNTDDGLWVTVRAIPRGREIDCFVLTPYYEEKFTEARATAFNGGEYRDDHSGLTYPKVAYYDDVLVRESTLEEEGISSFKLEYWDFAREDERGRLALYIVERNLKTGMLRHYLGTPCATADVRPIAGHTAVAA